MSQNNQRSPQKVYKPVTELGISKIILASSETKLCMTYTINRVLKRVEKDTHALFKPCVKQLERQKFGRIGVDCFCYSVNKLQRWISLSLLNQTQIGSMHSYFFRKFLLRDFLLLSQSLQALPKLFKGVFIWQGSYLISHAIECI